jgi:hypothetical protein
MILHRTMSIAYRARAALHVVIIPCMIPCMIPWIIAWIIPWDAL